MGYAGYSAYVCHHVFLHHSGHGDESPTAREDLSPGRVRDCAPPESGAGSTVALSGSSLGWPHKVTVGTLGIEGAYMAWEYACPSGMRRAFSSLPSPVVCQACLKRLMTDGPLTDCWVWRPSCPSLSYWRGAKIFSHRNCLGTTQQLRPPQ